MEQLLKKDGYAAIVLPQSILSNSKYENMRSFIFSNFVIKGLLMTSDITFSGTTTSPVILFLKKEKRANKHYKVCLVGSPKYLTPTSSKMKSKEVIICFTVYNGILGFLYDSIWHICIFAYYMFLLLIKGLLVFGISHKKTRSNQLIIVYITFIILIIMTIAMIAPAFLLVLDKRTYNLGLIPSIAAAAYTTYCITMSIVNMKKAKNTDSPIIKQIRLVNIVNTLMSILVLQNTLILANGGYTDDMKKLSMATSVGIIVLIIIIEIYQFILVKANHSVFKKR